MANLICPSCGGVASYIGLIDVECTNSGCSNYVVSASPVSEQSADLIIIPDCSELASIVLVTEADKHKFLATALRLTPPSCWSEYWPVYLDTVSSADPKLSYWSSALTPTSALDKVERLLVSVRAGKFEDVTLCAQLLVKDYSPFNSLDVRAQLAYRNGAIGDIPFAVHKGTPFWLKM